MTVFIAGDLVEHDFNGEKTLGIVETTIDDQNLRATKRDGTSHTWRRDQCTVIARGGQWVATVQIKESTNFVDNFNSVVAQLQQAGVEATTIAGIAYEFGKHYDQPDKNGTLRQILEDDGFSVRWV